MIKTNNKRISEYCDLYRVMSFIECLLPGCRYNDLSPATKEWFAARLDDFEYSED